MSIGGGSFPVPGFSIEGAWGPSDSGYDFGGNMPLVPNEEHQTVPTFIKFVCAAIVVTAICLVIFLWRYCRKSKDKKNTSNCNGEGAARVPAPRFPPAPGPAPAKGAATSSTREASQV